MNLRTFKGRIAVKPDPEKTQIGLIHIPDSARTPSTTGTVISVGTECDVRKDDRVVFMKKAGHDLVVDGQPIIVMPEYEVLAVVVEEQLRAIGTMVIIKPEPPDERIGLIHIPDPAAARAREKLVVGTIVAKGPGLRLKDGKRWPMADVKVGEKVLYFQNYVPEFEFKGEKYITVGDDSVRAVIED